MTGVTIVLDFGSLGEEELVLSAHGEDAVSLAVTHPSFGRVSTVRLDADTAAELAGALTGLLLDRCGVPEPE